MNLDIISTAVVGYLTFAGEEAARAAISDVYEQLKKLIFKKAPQEQKELEVALKGIEQNPKAEVYPMLFAESMRTSGLAADPEVMALAKSIIEQLQKTGAGSVGGVQTAMGSYIAQADRGGYAQVNVNQREIKK